MLQPSWIQSHPRVGHGDHATQDVVLPVAQRPIGGLQLDRVVLRVVADLGRVARGVDQAAARQARARGMTVVMGGPNLIRGGSYSGNVPAADLAQAAADATRAPRDPRMAAAAITSSRPANSTPTSSRSTCAR